MFIGDKPTIQNESFRDVSKRHEMTQNESITPVHLADAYQARASFLQFD
jgi:hypothetical protein